VTAFQIPAAGPFTKFEVTRAKRVQEVMWELLAAGCPGGYFVAADLNDGRTVKAGFPTKAAAIAHVPDPSRCAFLSLPHDGVVSWVGVAAFLRYTGKKEAYWRDREDLHLVLPTGTEVNGGGYQS
jgi:hypothetical protein